MQSFDQQASRLAPALTVPDKEFNFAYMRDLVNDLKTAHRLSVTFRFPKNSAVLDEKARADIPRLAAFLKSNAGKFTEVLLAGFTDNTGTFDGNRATALARATSFKVALVAEGVPASADRRQILRQPVAGWLQRNRGGKGQEPARRGVGQRVARSVSLLQK